MKCVVFLPGVMGSELRHAETNKRIWPPTLTALIAKNLNIDTLLDEHLVATKPIETVTPFYSVYRSVLRDIETCGYSVNSDEKFFIPFAYDWRKSNEVSARAVSAMLNQQQHFDDIVLIGHSMGGLVLRYLLESGEFDKQPWFPSVSQLITLGTPHAGAAEALKQAAGLNSNLGLSASNVKKLMSDPRYPSGYQLIAPQPNAMTLRAASSNGLPEVFSPFDAELVKRYDLELSNIEASKRFWSKLDLTKRPDNVRYFSFVGSAHKTLTRLDWTGGDLIDREFSDSGDGTVPISSSLNALIPHSFSQKKHSTIFADRTLRSELFRMLGAPTEVIPHNLAASSDGADIVDADVIGISTDRETYNPVDSMEVVVSFLMPQTNPKCRFQLVPIDPESDAGDMLESVSDVISVAFRGVAVENFKFSIAIDLEPGVYELVTANRVDDPERSFFVVTE